MTEQAAGLLGSPMIIPESNRFLHNQRLGLVTYKENKKIHTNFLFLKNIIILFLLSDNIKKVYKVRIC